MTVTPRPIVLAPAGDAETFQVALGAGADAVYLGLDDGFNARARAANFALDALPALVERAHFAGVELYVTLNTLLFESELAPLEQILREVARAGADAILLQDPAVALLARAVCPALTIHASTQMTISSAAAARFAARLGATRVVLPRELSVVEIAALAAQTPELELEAFVHGALCISWSGQCLASQTWSGRSANRGVCAQYCRMPYELVVDGSRRPLGERCYLLSPRDLSGLESVAELLAAGVRAFKIEGRLKGATYVLTAVQALRHALAAAAAGDDGPEVAARREVDVQRLRLAYSRGFSPGFLQGPRHQTLVDGRFPTHRGAFLGVVQSVSRQDVIVTAPTAQVTPRAGMGLVFDQGAPGSDDEPGGPIFACEQLGDTWRLRFGQPGPAGPARRAKGPDLPRVRPGQRVWVTGDPSLQQEAVDLLAQGDPRGRLPATLVVTGTLGQPLCATLRCAAVSAEAHSTAVLAPATTRGLDAALLRDKLGALGGTPFHLAALDESGLAAGLHLPVSSLKALRRELVTALRDTLVASWRRPVREAPAVAELHAELLARIGDRDRGDDPALVALCRSDEHLDAAIAAGVAEVELDWGGLAGLRRAAERARAAGLRLGLATLRVQKPLEPREDLRWAALRPDALLLRHFGGLLHFAEQEAGAVRSRPTLHGDFSLNVTNSLTALYLLGLGLQTVTTARELRDEQLLELLDRVPAHRVAVTVHHHAAAFHTEHCLYAHTLSDGTDARTCGRPCDRHHIALRDHQHREHAVVVDVGCRNTVFDSVPQSAARLVPALLARGVRRLRVELAGETRAEAEAVLRAQQALLRVQTAERPPTY